MPPKKVICGMSGGGGLLRFCVYSSTTRLPSGRFVYEKLGKKMTTRIIVQPPADLADAQAVCDKLGIKLHKINFAAEYWDNVFEHF